MLISRQKTELNPRNYIRLAIVNQDSSKGSIHMKEKGILSVRITLPKDKNPGEIDNDHT
ncbi:MAG: hypothetical protein ACW98X_11485 [Promethearchaeota archaeon]